MPVISGKYSNNETQIYSYLVGTIGLSTAAACGILANIEKESGFNHDQNNGQGTWDVNGYSYGLCQWHDKQGQGGRFTNLKNYCSRNGLSYRSISGQLAYLNYELKNSYKGVYNTLTKVSDNAQGAYDAAYKWCTDFEVPADRYNVGRTRGNIAKNTYYPYYSKNGLAESNRSAPDIGKKIVQIARSTLGLNYIQGGDMYNNNKKGADCSGLVYYCYKEVGIDLGRSTVSSIYHRYRSIAKKISPSNVAAADLLFYENDRSNTGLDHIAIANGSGGRIHAKESYGIVEESGLGNPTYILRILSDSEISQEYLLDTNTSSGVIVEGLDPSFYESVTSHDPYAISISSNLSRVKAEGYDYGYLIDMTHGGEFKFYVPEFSEQAGANWSDIDIRGRSVNIKSYESTSSRNITVSLDLYAGVGLYKSNSSEDGEDTVSRLHKDMFFVKSLEYPDYTNVITRPPSVVTLMLGSAINISGIVSNVTVEHLKPLDSQNRAMYMKLSFTVTQIATNPIDYKDVRQGQYTLTSTSNIDSLLVEDARQKIVSANNPPLHPIMEEEKFYPTTANLPSPLNPITEELN